MLPTIPAIRHFTESTQKILAPVRGLFSDDYLALDCTDNFEHFTAVAYREFNEKILFQRDADGNAIYELKKAWPSSAAQSWAKNLPEAQQVKSGYNYPAWKIAATDISAQIIRSNWSHDNGSKLRFESENAQILYQYLISQWSVQEKLADNFANYKASRAVPEACTELEVSAELPLTPYQKVAAVNCMLSEGYALFFKPGVGKTAPVIATICNEAKAYYAKTGYPYRAIIIPPKNVKMNWQNEFLRFSTQCMAISVIRGNQLDRVKQLTEALMVEPEAIANIVIASYETVVKSWESLQYVDWQLACCDESHFIKNQATKRWKFLKQLRDKSQKRIILTGTPIANTPLDLYTQLEFLGQGWSGFSSWEAWRKFYGVYSDGENGNGRKELVGMQNLPFMQERLTRLSMIISKEEALPDLPGKVYDQIEVEMSDEQSEAYDKAAASIAYEIENTLDSSIAAIGKAMTMNNVLTRLLRLAQITCGFVTWDEQRDIDTDEIIQPKEIEWFAEQPKLDALIELLKEKEADEKTIIWSCWVPVIEQISERLQKEGLGHVTYYGKTSEKDKAEAEEAYNCEPEYSIFVGNPASGGVGLNLVGYPYHDAALAAASKTDTTHIIHYAGNWSATQREQGEDRGHRRTTRRNVRVTDLCVPNSIDEEIRTRVMGKMLQAMEVSDLRVIIQNVLQGIGNHAAN